MTGLSPQLFAVFAGLVEQTAGLHYAAADRELFASKLIAHASERGHDALLDYYYRLRYDDATGAELASLVEALLVHETYLFREVDALTELVDGQLVPIVRAGRRARAWSAACSTGEEPYTLAMLLDARGVLDAVDIVATDISPAVIERARQGKLGRRALRDGHPVELAARYTEAGAHGVAVAPRIRGAVQFSALNLVGPAAPGLGRFDVILCRNVLIYFHEDQILRVIDRLTEHLAPGGLIAVGASESLLRFGTRLVCEERGRSFFYRSAP
ncbi:MAG TPA: protein-glutamate O-methyltransferase CheR [Kofleriaceae bacterium]|nr:protein-glutamate O-methyltransferase CheR [Kofleriaceae bacterium]